MKNFWAAIHALHEDTRKLLAGITIAIVGIGFVGLWTSFMSSRLVALGPPARENAAVGGATVPVARRLSAQEIAEAKRNEPPSPAAGIAGSISDAGKFLAHGKKDEADMMAGGFFASVGQGLAAVAEAIYIKLAPWVPPY